MKLHTDQKNAVEKIQALLSEGERPICYAPTGAGKTVIAGEVFGRVDKGLKVFVVHTDQLRQQASEALRPFGVVVVTIQTMLLNPDMFAAAVLVCFDECHHLQGQSWREAAAIFSPDCGMFGLSATPYACALDELFTVRLTIATIEELIRGGFILPVLVTYPSEAFVAGLGLTDRVDGALAYADAYKGRQAVHFEPTIELCERALQQYESLGVAAAVVTGKTAVAVRDLQIDRFRSRDIQVLISPVLLSEGFDAPCAEVLVAGRAFASDVLIQQAVGRIRRAYPGKTCSYVICLAHPARYSARCARPRRSTGCGARRISGSPRAWQIFGLCLTARNTRTLCWKSSA
jgi:superfamily II DNA or RNA helicase